MKKYLLLDVDDTIAPLMYMGSDAIEIETWGRGHLAIPRYLVDWLKAFSKKENNSIWWCTDRTSETTQIERQVNLKIDGKLNFTGAPKGTWKKFPTILKFALDHPESLVICADNDAYREYSRTDLPSNLHFIVPSGKIGALSKEDLEVIDNIRE
ncbi:hypothetical protein OZX68_05455 [Streptococcaceae bacterium ESL0729]|nr:hypothetical protein OZX68_05455 [Streptococcaceae bacterium ESL0729]